MSIRLHWNLFFHPFLDAAHFANLWGEGSTTLGIQLLSAQPAQIRHREVGGLSTTFIVHGSGSWKSEITVPAQPGSGEDIFLGCGGLTSLVFLFCLSVFLGLHPRHMEVPRLGVQLELQLLAYARATATQGPATAHSNTGSLTTEEGQGSNPCVHGLWSGSLPMRHKGNSWPHFSHGRKSWLAPWPLLLRALIPSWGFHLRDLITSQRWYWGWGFQFFYFTVFIFSIIVDLWCSVHFYCTAEWPSHTYTYILHFFFDTLMACRSS